MAQNFRNYLKRNTGTVAVDLLGGAVGSSTYDCIVSLRLANTTTSTITVEVYITDTDNFYLIKNCLNPSLEMKLLFKLKLLMNIFFNYLIDFV